MEVGEDVELGVEGLADLQPDTGIAGSPSECLAGSHLQARQVDISRLEQPLVLGRKILTHNGNQPYRGEQRRGKTEIAGRSSEDLIGGLGRRAHGIEGNRADDEDWPGAGCHLRT